MVEMLFKMFRVRGSEAHPCRLAFKNTKKWIRLSDHENLSDHESFEEDRLENLWSLSKQTSQATKRRQFLSLFMKKIRWPRLYVFLLKKFKAWVLKKFRLLFLPSFSTEAKKIFSIFSFASFYSFKALTGCLKIFKIYRNDLVFKKICPSTVLRLECLFRCYSFYTQT